VGPILYTNCFRTGPYSGASAPGYTLLLNPLVTHTFLFYASYVGRMSDAPIDDESIEEFE